MTSRTRSRLYAATLSLCAAPPLFATNTPYYFVGPNNSFYSDPANWSLSPSGPGGSPPGTNDLAYVTPNTFRQITLDASPNNVSLQSASFAGPSAGDTLLVTATAPSFVTTNLLVGPNVLFTQSAGQISTGTSGTTTITGPAATYSLSNS